MTWNLNWVKMHFFFSCTLCQNCSGNWLRCLRIKCICKENTQIMSRLYSYYYHHLLEKKSWKVSSKYFGMNFWKRYIPANIFLRSVICTLNQGWNKVWLIYWLKFEICFEIMGEPKFLKNASLFFWALRNFFSGKWW